MTLLQSSLPPLTSSRLAQSSNAILAAMNDADRALLAPEATLVTLERNAVLTEPGVVIEAAYFIEGGVASVVKPDGRGDRTEICMVGRENFAGTPLVSADGQWPYLTFVQAREFGAVRVPAAALVRLLEQSVAARTLLLRAVHAQMIQIAEGLVSAAWQRLPARLARWLLLYRDRLDSERIEVTHEFLSIMVGAQRTGITAALHCMEGDGLIVASRGLIMIRDAPALERIADGGYGVAEAETRRLLPA